MALADTSELAVQLATTVIKIAGNVSLGPAGPLIEPFTALAQRRARSLIDKRRTTRLLEECVDIVADRYLTSLQHDFHDLPANERQAAILAVQRTLQESGVTVADVVRNDLDIFAVLRSLQATSAETLRQALLSEGAEQLYSLLLRDSCAYLIETVKTLDTFGAEVLTELLRRETDLKQELAKAMRRLPEARDGRAFDVNYRRAVTVRLDRLEIIGASLSRANRRYQLSVAYIGLRLLRRPGKPKPNSPEPSKPEPGKPGSGKPDKEDSPLMQVSTSLRIEDLMAQNKRLLLIGDAGSGKTTLLRWLAVQAARREFNGPHSSTWNGFVPFFIPLRRYADREFPTPAEFIDAIGSNLEEETPDGWVTGLLRSGKALVLIDGLDEIGEESKRREAEDWIDTLVAEFANATYVVTSRPAGIGPDWHNPSFLAAELQPMGPGDIEVFVGRWHEAVAQELGDSDEVRSLAGDRRAIMAALEADRHLRMLADNPLLCALLCALNRERNHHLPKQRVDIYTAALGMLLGRRDEERGIPAKITLDASTQTILLRKLAFWLLRQNMLDVPTERAVEVIGRSISSLPEQNLDPRDALDYLLTRSGLLREAVVGRIDFVHRTFQDYLAAEAAVENDEIGLLLDHAGRDHWRDVIVMASARARQHQREELLRGLIARGRKSGNRQLLILVVACLHNAPELDPALRMEIENIARGLLPPRTTETAQALAATGDLVLEVLAERPPREYDEVNASIKLAGMIGSDRALSLLREIARTRTGVMDELIRTWRLFDLEKYAREVLSAMTGETALSIRDMETLPYLGHLKTARELRLGTPGAATLKLLGDRPPNVTRLTVARRPRTTLDGIERWDGLEELVVLAQNTLPGLRPIAHLTTLQTLVIVVDHGIAVNVDLSSVAALPRLRSLTVSGETNYRLDLAALRRSPIETMVIHPSSTVTNEDLLPDGCTLIRSPALPVSDDDLALLRSPG
jgi:hypothetical protein